MTKSDENPLPCDEEITSDHKVMKVMLVKI